MHPFTAPYATAAPAETTKPKYPRALALQAAKEICDALKPSCDYLIVAGSLRRRKEMVGDVEILFIPKLEPLVQLRQADLDLVGTLSTASQTFKNLAEQAIERLVQRAVILQRKNINGSITWGPQNKLALHVGTGIPVDLFTATRANRVNYLVCRTGGAQNNVRIASAAQKKGWQWNPYREGFTDEEGNTVPVHSERDVFHLVGLPYLEPWQRL